MVWIADVAPRIRGALDALFGAVGRVARPAPLPGGGHAGRDRAASLESVALLDQPRRRPRPTRAGGAGADRRDARARSAPTAIPGRPSRPSTSCSPRRRRSRSCSTPPAARPSRIDGRLALDRTHVRSWGVARIRSSESASILHADLDSFFASVEQRDDPRLRGRPVIVGGGVVLAASYEAKAYGVRSAMGGRQAQRLCPDALVVPPRFSAYVEASRAVFADLRRHHAAGRGRSRSTRRSSTWAACAGWSATPRRSARRCAQRVRDEVGLPISVGIARTKYLAKVASAVCKPDGLLRVPPDGEQEFLHPLPVERLWGVGAVTAAKLHADGIRTIGELARREELELTAAVGQAAGRHLWALANLRDPRPVEVGRRRRSIGSQARDRPRRSPQVPRGPRRAARRAGRPGRPAAARGRADRPDVHAAAALRRLHPGDPLVDDPAIDGVDRDLARDRSRAARRGLAADRGARLHAARHHHLGPRRRERRRAARAAALRRRGRRRQPRRRARPGARPVRVRAP